MFFLELSGVFLKFKKRKNDMGVFQNKLDWKGKFYTWCSHLFFGQVSRMEEQVNSLKQSNENLQKHVEDLLSKLKEVRRLEVFVKSHYICFYKMKN